MSLLQVLGTPISQSGIDVEKKPPFSIHDPCDARRVFPPENKTARAVELNLWVGSWVSSDGDCVCVVQSRSRHLSTAES